MGPVLTETREDLAKVWEHALAARIYPRVGKGLGTLHRIKTKQFHIQNKWIPHDPMGRSGQTDLQSRVGFVWSQPQLHDQPIHLVDDEAGLDLRPVARAQGALHV
jgi:hypothetical protein